MPVPARAATSGFGEGTSNGLPPTNPGRMTRLPMPRTSPDDGGLYDEDCETLVEVHR